MSDANPQTPQNTMTPDDVIAFLKDNPNFLQENPEAIDLIIPTKNRPKRGEIADFQSYMIERLKSDKEDIIESTRELVENSRANMNNQQRVHESVLRLLEAHKFDEFIHTMTLDLATILGLDIAVFLVETTGDEIPHIQTSGIRLLPEGTINDWMDGKTALQQSDISGIEAIYGGGAGIVKSQILLRIDISMDTPPAILAFGSRDPHMFNENQATDQILFLARVIERGFRSWLNLPA